MRNSSHAVTVTESKRRRGVLVRFFSSSRTKAISAKVGSIAGAGATFALAYNYLPDAFYSEASGKYVVSGSLALACFACIGWLRERIARTEKEDSRRSISPMPEFRKVSTRIGDTLASNMRPADVVAGGRGWCHYLGPHSQEQEVAALSTTYALRTLNLFMRRPKIAVDAAIAVVSALQQESGGWAAQSQHRPSPEVTASVLSTLYTFLGNHESVLKGRRALEGMLDQSVDSVPWQNTYVAANILIEISGTEFNAEKAARLLSALTRGVVSAEGGQFFWAEKLVDLDDSSPSVPLTAMAIVAIHASLDHGVDSTAGVAQVLEGAVRWLRLNSDLGNETSQVVRSRSRLGQDLYVARLFTSAWVVRALLAHGLPREDPAVTEAMRTVWQYYGDGLWHWNSGERPTWMTYQGACAVAAYSAAG